jgi:ketosteroid isomerase-like protein
MAETREETLRRFFQHYAKASLDGDADAVASAYAPSYIESSPDTFAAWKVDEAYRAALSERHVLMKEHLGLTGLDVEISRIEEVAPRHFLVAANWSMAFTRAKTGHVTSRFQVTYVVKLQARPEILAYLSHESEEAVLRRDGVI